MHDATSTVQENARERERESGCCKYFLPFACCIHIPWHQKCMTWQSVPKKSIQDPRSEDCDSKITPKNSHYISSHWRCHFGVFGQVFLPSKFSKKELPPRRTFGGCCYLAGKPTTLSGWKTLDAPEMIEKRHGDLFAGGEGLWKYLLSTCNFGKNQPWNCASLTFVCFLWMVREGYGYGYIDCWLKQDEATTWSIHSDLVGL